jgi:aminomethyltransferase
MRSLPLPIEIAPDEPPPPKPTPLAALHQELGARMAPFANWILPIQYPSGILAEHRHCRAAAALFDVSHMGQVALRGPDSASALERLTVADLASLRAGRQRYSLMTNEAGGVLDDIMIARLPSGCLHVVVNAERTADDVVHLRRNLPPSVSIDQHSDRAMLALQGPQAAAVLARHAPEVTGMQFMDVAEMSVLGATAIVSRSGYTGEDGFEIALPVAHAEHVARALLAEPEVEPAGLGARDTLRLEAGLPLYGHDLDELTTPVEAGVAWAIGKRRRMAWDFPGAAAIRDQLDNGATRCRVGLRIAGSAPARAGCNLTGADSTAAGSVTSGTYSPTLLEPIAMAYVRRDLAADGTELFALLRGASVPARVVPLPFVPHRYAQSRSSP